MALQMNFTDNATGAAFAASYWRVGEVILSRRQNRAVVQMLAFKDAASAANKKPVAEKLYVLDGADFTNFRNAVIEKGAANVEALAYAHVKTSKEPASDQSFFAGAADV